MPTLYGVLGVEPDADEQSIRRAFRERAKRHHPDVTDAPDAREQFRRLTTAKAVLTDAEERARYDRLGHETYVGRHLDDSWTVDAATAPTVDGDRGSERVGEAAQRMAEETATAATERRETQRVDRSDGYPTAAEYYRPGQRFGVESAGGLARTLGALREVLPWLVAHLLLLGGALTVAALLLGSTGGVPSVTTIVVATAMVGVTAGVSVLHLSAALFR